MDLQLFPINIKTMKKLLASLFFIFFHILSYSQNVGIGTNSPNASAALEIQDTSRGILIPRMTMAQRIAIQNPAEGLMVYQTDSTYGQWYYARNQWRNINSNNAVSTITTTQTGLSYVIPNTNVYYWGQAIASCAGFTFNGISNWRIPSQDEMLQLIIQYGNSIFPNGVAGYWTSSVISGGMIPNTGNPAIQPVYILINANDLAGNPIGPTFLQANQYSYNSVNPDKARVIYIR